MFKKSTCAWTALLFLVSCFRVSASNWTDAQRLLASPPEGGDAFGQRVALSGNTAIVASLFNDDAAPNDSGAVYVLERSEAGSWSQKGVLYARDAAAGDHFGSAIDIDGDILAATAREDGPSGSLYIFQRTGMGSTGFSLVKKVTAGSPPSTPFGESVSISGDRIAVGTRLGDQVYIYERNLGGPDNFWGQASQLWPGALQAGDRLGWAVALDGEFAILGAPGATDGSGETGVVFLFEQVLFCDGFESGTTARWN